MATSAMHDNLMRCAIEIAKALGYSKIRTGHELEGENLDPYWYSGGYVDVYAEKENGDNIAFECGELNGYNDGDRYKKLVTLSSEFDRFIWLPYYHSRLFDFDVIEIDSIKKTNYLIHKHHEIEGQYKALKEGHDMLENELKQFIFENGHEFLGVSPEVFKQNLIITSSINELNNISEKYGMPFSRLINMLRDIISEFDWRTKRFGLQEQRSNALFKLQRRCEQSNPSKNKSIIQPISLFYKHSNLKLYNTSIV